MAKNNQKVSWTDNKSQKKGNWCVCGSSWRCRCRAQITGR